MKKIYKHYWGIQTPTKMLFIALFFLFHTHSLSSQISATVTGGNCAGSFTLSANGTQDGKNKYSGNIVGAAVDLAWNATSLRWEISNPLAGVVFFNTTNTSPDPPCHDNGTWTSLGFCVGGTFSASSGNCIIPVELLSFSAKNTSNTNVLTWQTATEIKNKGFEIERSNDAMDWQTISFVAAKGNNSIYTFTDKSPLPISYYRLRQIDFDGQFDYSKTVVAHAANIKSHILVFPNPNTEGVLHIQGLSDEETTVSITNIYGQVIFQQTVASETVVLNVKNVLSPGVYFVNFKTNNSFMSQKITLD